LTDIAAALAPVFLLILCGWGLRRGGWFGEAFWADVDRLVFYLLFPAYLVIRIATADLAGLSLGPMGLGVAAGLFAMAALAFLLKPLSGLDGPGFGAAFQGCMRPNIYVGFAAAEALGQCLRGGGADALRPRWQRRLGKNRRRAGPQSGDPGDRGRAGDQSRRPGTAAGGG
jgi:hypothetical protein